MKKIIKIVVFFCSIVASFSFFINKIEKKCGVHFHSFRIYEKYLKRPLDFVMALLVAIFLFPVLVGTAIFVKIKLGSPILFSQDRPGRGEKVFRLFKFRTMTDARDKNGNLLSDEERLTVFGKKLRSTSLDELPELINIIKGDMSFVGPRPLLVSYLPYYNERERKRHSVRPGLTGLAQVSGRNNLKWNERFELDVKYAESISFIGDIKIILLTIQRVIMRTDVSVDSSEAEGNFAELRKLEQV